MTKQESRIRFNEELNRTEVDYLFTENIFLLKDNKGQAIGFQKGIEKKLKKNPDELNQYNAELKKAIDRGYVKKLNDEDLLDWKGPVSYISHHPVYKSESKSTPLRIVCNSSLKNKTCGLSLNECMPKPPNELAT